jgi:Ca-activated chloride channel family protein
MFLFAFLGSVPRAEVPEAAVKTLSPYFHVLGTESGLEAFPLKSTEVDATVNGVIADVRVRQTYANEGALPIHARYVFPGSTRAALHGMSIRIGDEVTVAKIKEREQAKQEYETAKAQGKSASLLEQHRPNVFTMSVANILPMDRVEVELHYTELLVPTDGVYQFVYPTVVGPRYSNRPAEAPESEATPWVKSPYLHEGDAPPTRFTIRVTLSTAIPLRDVHCLSHAAVVDWKRQDLAEVSLANSADFAGDRDFILDYRLAGEEIQSGLLLYQGEQENFFLLMVQPPEQVRSADIPPREYIFVLDVSGSMDGFPLATAKSLISDLIGGLRPTDLFNVVLFAGGDRVLASSSLEASQENVRRALRAIEAERGGGGTEIVPALKTAMDLPRDEHYSRTVVVITDGFVAAEEEVFSLIATHLDRTNVFSFGIGSGVNRYLVEGMAKAGLGEPFVVTEPGEADEAARKFREYIASPVLTHVQIQFEGFEAYDVEPPAIPDLFARRPVVVFGKWRGPLGGKIELAGESGAGSYTRTLRVADTPPAQENAALRPLWARAKLARLSDFNTAPQGEQVVRQIVQLGLTYSLLTKYTSFVAVLEKVRNLDPSTPCVNQPLPLPRGVSDAAVGGYEVGPEPELWTLLALAAFIVSTVLWRRYLMRRI